ncbi:hypothetical protein RC62_3360 [Flavobacterium aquidurense]|uniref:Uncharacterized protein n=2 Tax=Flavobacterium aquidurense TaxID=362413 RepID=A0A0Q0W772_9FLAO|nr:hypothetical protein RC62_3360 [Flavobacterium aquidurense]
MLIFISSIYAQEDDLKNTKITNKIKTKFGDLIISQSIGNGTKFTQISSFIRFPDDCEVQKETIYVNFDVDSNCIISSYEIDKKGKNNCATITIKNFCDELIETMKKENLNNVFDKSGCFRLPFVIQSSQE